MALGVFSIEGFSFSSRGSKKDSSWFSGASPLGAGRGALARGMEFRRWITKRAGGGAPAWIDVPWK